MVKFIVRLLVVMIFWYAGGYVSQLFATQNRELPTVSQDKRVSGTGLQTPTSLGPGGCSCNGQSTPGPYVEAKPEEQVTKKETETTEQEEKAETTGTAAKPPKTGKPASSQTTAEKPEKAPTTKPPVASPAPALPSPPAPNTVQVTAVRGYDAASWGPFVGSKGKENLAEVFDNQQNTNTSDVENENDFLNAMNGADIFYANVHGNNPQERDEHHLQVGKGVFLSAQKLAAHRQQVGEANMPRLTILNGCNTATPADPQKPVMTINQGLGIDNSTKGRAMLGFTGKVVGFANESNIKKVLEVWSHPAPKGNYPTLRQAIIKALGPNHNIIIIGDHNLRYTDMKK